MRSFWAPTKQYSIAHRGFEALEPRLTLSASPTVVAVEVASTSWSSAFYDHLEDEGLGQFGYAIQSGTSQQKSLPWSNLNRVYITFSEDVHVDANDLAITGVSIAQYGIADFLYDPQLRTARWTLTQVFSGDRILLDLDGDGKAPVTNLSDQPLDGEWVNSSTAFPSGDGEAGGDFEFLINALVGDVTREGAVSYTDYSQVYIARNKTTAQVGYKPMYDVDGNGTISSADYGAILSRLGYCVPTVNPVGMLNDAPTSSVRSLFTLDNNAIDEAFSLYELFDDTEDGPSSLSYALVGSTNASLLSSVTVDNSTGELRLSTSSAGSGISKLVVRATDSGGLYTDHEIRVAVNHTNSLPVIDDYEILQDANGVYWLEARILDADEDTRGWMVEFSGVFEGRAVVDVEQRVKVKVVLPSSVAGSEYLTAKDSSDGAVTAAGWIGAT